MVSSYDKKPVKSPVVAAVTSGDLVAINERLKSLGYVITYNINSYTLSYKGVLVASCKVPGALPPLNRHRAQQAMRRLMWAHAVRHGYLDSIKRGYDFSMPVGGIN